VDRYADVGRVGAHFDRKGSFRDQIPSVSDQFVFEHRIADNKRSALLGRRLALMRIDRKQIAVTTR